MATGSGHEPRTQRSPGEARADQYPRQFHANLPRLVAIAAVFDVVLTRVLGLIGDTLRPR
jgi:hypothetical protein